MIQAPFNPPTVGQQFIDIQGTTWRVEDLVHSIQLHGFYIVRLSFIQADSREQGSLVLGRGEFQALCRDRKLMPAPEAGAGL